jgi:hypothetical protein
MEVNESGLSRVRYLVLFDTSLESNFVLEILNKSKLQFWTDLLLWEKIKYKTM